MRRRHTPKIPQPRKWFVDGFGRYCVRFLRKNFHALAVDTSGLKDFCDDLSLPLIVYANHPSWWDPIIGMVLHQRHFPKRTLYAPIDAKALQQYPIFRQLGFYGIALNSLDGAAEFLLASREIMNRSASAIWITPEGRFADPRDHVQPLMPGLVHLTRDERRPFVIPLAIEYPFWEERQPEALAYFGTPFRFDPDSGMDKVAWGAHLTRQLRETQKRLATLSIQRDCRTLEIVLSGKLRRSWYDYIRSLGQLFRGERPSIEHSRKFTSAEITNGLESGPQ